MTFLYYALFIIRNHSIFLDYINFNSIFRHIWEILVNSPISHDSVKSEKVQNVNAISIMTKYGWVLTCFDKKTF